jgi:hypothetical protein
MKTKINKGEFLALTLAVTGILGLTVGCGGGGGGNIDPTPSPMATPVGGKKYTATVITTTNILRGINNGILAGSTDDDRAVIIPASGGSNTNLQPTSDALKAFNKSSIQGISGTTYVGEAWSSENASVKRHAMAWAGSAGSAKDIHPINFNESIAFAVSGNKAVGRADQNNATSPSHATLWDLGSSTSVDIHPVNLSANRSAATDIDGNVIVGFYTTNTSNLNNTTLACVWTDGTSNAIEVKPPAGSASCNVRGVSGTTLVGSAVTTSGIRKATLWRGTSGSAASAVDLSPSGAISSGVSKVSGTTAVGEAWLDGSSHAATWDTTTGAFTDLQGSLDGVKPGGQPLQSSTADFVDVNGDILGHGFEGKNQMGKYYFILWRKN